MIIRLAILRFWAFAAFGGFLWLVPLRVVGFVHKPSLRWDMASNKWKFTDRLHVRVRDR